MEFLNTLCTYFALIFLNSGSFKINRIMDFYLPFSNNSKAFWVLIQVFKTFRRKIEKFGGIISLGSVFSFLFKDG